MDPLGVSIAIANGNLGLDIACIWFKTFWHLDIVPLVLEVDREFANLMTELIAVLSGLFNGKAVEDFTVVNGGDKAKGDGMDCYHYLCRVIVNSRRRAKSHLDNLEGL